MKNTNTNIIDQLSFIDSDQKEIIKREFYKSQIYKDINILDVIDVIRKLKIIDEDYITSFINKNNKFDFSFDKQLIKKIPYNFCITKKCLPVSINDEVLTLLIVQNNLNTIKEINMYINFKNVELVICSNKELFEYIEKNYTEFFDFCDLLDDKYSNSTELFVDRLFFDAVNKNATDIHISQEEYIVKVRYRIDGQLKKIFTFHKDYYDKILVRLKLLFSVDIGKSLKSKDGSLSKYIYNQRRDFRASFHYCIYGENVVIRVLNIFAISKLEDIGYSDLNLQNINKMINKEGGLIILIGPTGSGKTTSLYSILKKIDPIKNNIMTIEDPVECYVDSAQQTDINYHPEATFSNCLRSILRQNPDCILIGEIRDKDTALIALRAAMTGHKVFTTLHAKDIFSVFDRFVEFDINYSMCVNSICGIVSQRLVKKKCIYCTDGCSTCFDSKFFGRCVVAESLFFSQKVIEVLLENTSNFNKYKKLKDLGFCDLYEDALLMCKKNIINFEQIKLFKGVYEDI